MKLSPEFKQKLKDSLNIVDLIGEHVVLRKQGSNFVGLCPFHSERSPSFSVSEGKQRFHCFGCKKGGDVIDFFKDIHGLDFLEAIEELAERGRVQLPKDFSGAAAAAADPETARLKDEDRKRLETMYRLNRFVAAFYHQQLSQLPAALEYFRNRGVPGYDSELCRNFYLGASAPAWDSLTQYLISKKAPLDLAVELGLIQPSTKGATPGGPGYFDLFRNRVIFPILDLRGRVTGFGGRAMPDGDQNPKYLNSRDSRLFQKSKLVFGLYQAQKHLRERDEVILVEGYFDVLGLHAGGFPNAVAACGTALTVEHLHLLKKFASKILVLFDGDKAGIAATERAMELGLEQGMVLRGAKLPEGRDPDEILIDQRTGKPIPEGQAQMKELLDGARPLIDTRIDEAIAFAAQGPEAKSQAIKKVAGWLVRFSDPVGREVRIQHVLQGLKIPRELLDSAMGRPSPQSGGGSMRGERMPPQRPASVPRGFGHSPSAPPVVRRQFGAPSERGRQSRLNQAESLILRALAQGGAELATVDQILARLAPKMALNDLFEHTGAREFVYRLITPEPGNEGSRDIPGRVSRLLDEQEWDPQVRTTLTEAMFANREAEGQPQLEDYKAAVERSIQRALARFSHRIKQALTEAEAKKDAELQDKLMKEYLDVQRKMKEFSSFYDEA